MGREIVVGLHFYQPPREATHPLLSKISTDPQNKNWTAIIEKQCYKPLAEEGILNKVSFDIYQSLLIQLEKINPETAKIYEKAMRENGIGEAFIHPILPDLSRIDKTITVSAGVKRFKEITGISPKIFWPPETAIDTETLEVLAENGYQGFVCAPEQIVQQDGGESDNQPTLINLPHGKQLVAYPFDRPISSNLAFDPKQNADIFASTYIKPRSEKSSNNKVLIAWTDAETFGHHYQQADRFLKYLLEASLPSIGLYPVSINDLVINRSKLPNGKIVERSAWSCPHGNLIRWNGSCDCGYGYDTSWKKPFISAMEFVNESVSQILKSEIGPGYEQKVSDNFYGLFSQPEKIDSPEKALVASKISSLIAKTSCATFFANPDASGKINLLYAYQALEYLRFSGLEYKEAVIRSEFFNKLSQIRYPNSSENALSVLRQMLS